MRQMKFRSPSSQGSRVCIAYFSKLKARILEDLTSVYTPYADVFRRGNKGTAKSLWRIFSEEASDR